MGRFLFRYRSITPIPIIVSACVFQADPIWLGAVLLVIGEAIRLLAVSVIGGISRTREDIIGPLCTDGIFSLSRNPLYIGNLLLWMGFLLLCGNLVIMMCSVLFLWVQYQAIICWEETMLLQIHKERYVEYCQKTNRYFSVRSYQPAVHKNSGVILRSERGTLLTISGMLLVIGWIQCI